MTQVLLELRDLLDLSAPPGPTAFREALERRAPLVLLELEDLLELLERKDQLERLVPR